MSTLEFVHDPALDQTFGTGLVTLLTGAVEPGGDCVACGQLLGSQGQFRLAAQVSELGGAVVAAVHAPCGGGVNHTSFLSVPPSTWLAASFGNPVNVVTPRRLFRKEKTESRVVPVVAIKPSCDVFVLTPTSDGKYEDPLQTFRGRGYEPLGESFKFGDDSTPPDDEEPGLRIAPNGLYVADLFETYVADVQGQSQVVADSIRKADGIMVAFTLAPLPFFGDVASVIEIMHGGRSVFRWIPASRVVGL